MVQQRESKRLSIQTRFALITLYYRHRLFREKNHVKQLQLLARQSNIHAHRTSISKLLKKWHSTCNSKLYLKINSFIQNLRIFQIVSI